LYRCRTGQREQDDACKKNSHGKEHKQLLAGVEIFFRQKL
jgi:hypothetical protein